MKKCFSIISISLIFLVFSLIIFLNLQKIHCYDIWGHLSLGRYIAENFNLPKFDVFSYTSEGKFFYNFSWLYQILFFSLYVLTGIPGLIIAKTAVVFLCFYLMFFLGYKKIPLFFWIFIFLLAVLASNVRFFVRPQVFSFLFSSLYIFILAKYIEGNRKIIYFLPVIQVLWVNIHSISMMGPFIIFSFIAGEFLIKKVTMPFNWNKQALLTTKQIKEIFFVFIVCILASMINPYTWKIFSHYKSLFYTINIHRDLLPGGIQELRPLNLTFWNTLTSDFLYFKLLTFFVLSVILLNIKKQHISALILFIPFLFLAKKSIRNVALFSIISLFVLYLNKNLFSEFKIKVFKEKFLKKSALCINIILILLVVFFSLQAFKKGWELESYIDGRIIKSAGLGKGDFYPQAALEFIKENKIKGNIFNSFNYGHYIIWKGYPGIKVFVDGRTGVYQDYILRVYPNVFLFRQAIEYVVKTYNINYFLIQTHSGKYLSKYLYESNSWKLVFFDPWAVVFVKNVPCNYDVIKKHEVNLDLWKDKFNKLKEQNVSFYGKIKPEFLSIANEGFFFKNLRKYDYAKMAFKESIKLNPDIVNLYLNLANIYIEEENYKKALDILLQAEKRNLSSKILYTNLAYVYEKTGNDAKAVKLYEKAAGRWGELPSSEAYANLARLYYDRALYRKALVYAKRALKLDNNSFFNYYIIGTVYLSTGLYGRAIDNLEIAIKLNPGFDKAYNNLAVSYYEAGLKKQAEINLQKALEINSELETSKKLLKKIRQEK